MNENKFKLTETDYRALCIGDLNYINNKGANLYTEDTYGASVEYYRLAAAMGNIHAISNLGYCYLYGRDIEANTSLAIGYFMLAAHMGDADAAYKLGDIYSSDKWNVKDTEMSIYYYRMAASFIIGNEWEDINLIFVEELQEYPSLCFAFGREMSPEGNMCTDIERSYQFLLHAKYGYERALANGDSMYLESYNNLLKCIENDCYDSIRLKYNNLFKEEYEYIDEDE